LPIVFSDFKGQFYPSIYRIGQRFEVGQLTVLPLFSGS
jgi:hypothetical protein